MRKAYASVTSGAFDHSTAWLNPRVMGQLIGIEGNAVTHLPFTSASTTTPKAARSLTLPPGF